MATQKEFFKYFMPLYVALGTVFVVGDLNAATVAKRGTVSRNQVAVRAPVAAKADAVKVVDEAEYVAEEVVVEEETFEFEDRTSQFDDALGGTATATEASDGELAEMIRKQRAAADASSAAMTVKQNVKAVSASGKNACDAGLRKCMQAKCGADFAKCAGDTDTMFGDKLDACRRDLECSGHEYSVFTTEIKADRDANAELANFNAIINCGNKYNSCILAECGTTFSKCLGKSEGDKAVAKCKKIQTECTQLDNGLASRMMNVFAGVRQDAEKVVQRDEQRLYDLRDEMESVCRRMGAMFDARSLDCVYTVNFFADNSSTPYASKKAYAGGVFSCDPGWFGIDVTTFKENAYRLTREQTAASSAMLGSGIGMAAGAVTSGAIDRALETQKAKKELKEAQEGDKADKKAERQAAREEKKAEKEEKKEERQAAREVKEEEKEDKKSESEKESYDEVSARTTCEAAGGNWNKNNKKCRCKNANGQTINTKNPTECHVSSGEDDVVEDDEDFNSTEIACGNKGGDWSNGKCKCKNARGRNITTSNPVKDCVEQSAAKSNEEKVKEKSGEAEKENKNASQSE